MRAARKLIPDYLPTPNAKILDTGYRDSRSALYMVLGELVGFWTNKVKMEWSTVQSGYWPERVIWFQECDMLCQLLRDIFGNPFRPVTLDPRWLTSTVLDLARTIYNQRVWERMPILADALMDAGCDDAEILNHCRSAGPHVLGCWVVDLILGKE